MMSLRPMSSQHYIFHLASLANISQITRWPYMPHGYEYLRLADTSEGPVLEVWLTSGEHYCTKQA